MESGASAAALSAITGAPAESAIAAISYAVPLCAPGTVEIVYLTEKESENPAEYTARGCKGSSGEPIANPGKLCIFSGNAPGSFEPSWKNVKEAFATEPNGSVNEFSAVEGADIVYHTKGFSTGGAATVPTPGAFFADQLHWAVTAP